VSIAERLETVEGGFQKSEVVSVFSWIIFLTSAEKAIHEKKPRLEIAVDPRVRLQSQNSIRKNFRLGRAVHPRSSIAMFKFGFERS
jgi:hypothetical protein